MRFLDLAKSRYSVRKFAQKSVEQEKILSVLEAARLAPTAKNLQPQRILVLNDETALSKLKECTPCHYYAPLAFLISYDGGECYKRELDGHISGEIDAAITGTHMMLQAADIGLGTTWVMNFDPDKMKAAFHIPDGTVPTALLVCGYPREDCRPNSRHEQYKELSSFCGYNDYGKET